MRCFIGFFVPEGAKPVVLALQERLKRMPTDCKYVELENLHVSLSFLGELGDTEVIETEAKLDAVCAAGSRFHVVASAIKLIPNDSHARVVVLDVQDASGELGRLFEGVKRDIGGDAKPPHLTLCRIRETRDKPALADGVRKISFDPIEFDVGEVALIKSELGTAGPTYSVVKGFKLK
ncbi:MAG: RNA 2',3'-cyclic phosphodiesterase [Candidatus Aenigmarchaeota archaeon]|nr:RNA 2',3'-cyclic phosphodiesterase [Candidatus Aenigmarchaeota archaeon]